MAFFITDECIACGVCIPECPNNAIAEADIYIIDPNLCTECYGYFDTQQCVVVCPVDCCIPDENHKESKEELKQKAMKAHPDKTDWKF